MKIDRRYGISTKIFYCIILMRDFLCLAIMLFYQCRVQNRSIIFNRLLDLTDKDSTKVALNDLEMLLESVVPYMYFEKYLDKKKPEMIPYLQMVHLCKMYRVECEMLQGLLEDQQLCSEEVGLDHSSRKALSQYHKATQQVEALQAKLEARRTKAFEIAEAHRAIFVPVQLLQSVLTTQQLTGSFSRVEGLGT